MKKTRPPLNWKELDPQTLESDAAEAYRKFHVSYAKAKAARQRFETKCAKAARLPPSQQLLFSYKFERLSVAIAPAKQKNVGAKAIHFDSLKVGGRPSDIGKRNDLERPSILSDTEADNDR